MRILIVEDNEPDLRLLNDILEIHGYEILKTGRGREAIRLTRHHIPDLILMESLIPLRPGPQNVVAARADL
jgi:CheY-like chemotaxis protein